MTSVEQADAWIGRIGVDRAGRKIGKITRVWIDDYSGLPTWATLVTRRLGRREGIGPLSDVTVRRGRPLLGCTKAEFMSAPPVADDGHLGLDDEWRLVNHYKLAGTPDPTRPDALAQLLRVPFSSEPHGSFLAEGQTSRQMISAADPVRPGYRTAASWRRLLGRRL